MKVEKKLFKFDRKNVCFFLKNIFFFDEPGDIELAEIERRAAAVAVWEKEDTISESAGENHVSSGLRKDQKNK